MSDLVVIVPSRGRPHAVVELAKAFRGTCTGDTRLLFAVDSDDPVRPEYCAAVAEAMSLRASAGIGITTATMVPHSMVSTLNEAALSQLNINRCPVAIAFMGDDHRPRTLGWDSRYLEALRKLSTGIVYGNDLIQGHRLPTQCAMTADIIRTLGYMAPPGLQHMYVDNAWLALGRAIGGISYLPDVVIEHLHPVAGTAEIDEGYARVNAPEVYARDQAAYERWLTESLPTEAHRIRRMAAAS